MKKKTCRKSHTWGGLNRLRNGDFSIFPAALAFSNSGDSSRLFRMYSARKTGTTPVINAMRQPYDAIAALVVRNEMSANTSEANTQPRGKPDWMKPPMAPRFFWGAYSMAKV